jgi:hypothetical protein
VRDDEMEQKLQKARDREQRDEAQTQRRVELEQRRAERERLKEVREKERAEKAAERARQRRRETLLKLYNYPKRERGELQQLSHQVTSARNALALLTLVFKLKMSHLLHHPKLHHVAATSTFRRNIDSTN